MTLGCKYSNNGSIPGRRRKRKKKKENRKQVSNKKKTRRKEERKEKRRKKKKTERNGKMEKENRRKGDKFKAFYFPPRWRHSVFLCLAATNRRVNQIVYTLLSDYCF